MEAELDAVAGDVSLNLSPNGVERTPQADPGLEVRYQFCTER
jgi:hypothetical protein